MDYGSTITAPNAMGMSTAQAQDTSPRIAPPLHPNLARLAVIYDDVVAAHQAGRITTEQALAEIRKLHARDDQGVIWCLAPDGGWYRQTRDGRLVPGTPPQVGIPSITAFDVSPWGNSPQNPDNYLAKPDLGPMEYGRSSSRVADSPSLWRRLRVWPHRRLAVAVASIVVAAALSVASMVASAPDETVPDLESAPVAFIVEP